MKKTTENSSKDISHKFNLGSVTPVYTDGVTQIAVGIPNSRLIFDSRPAEFSADGSEVLHHVAVEIVLPTSALIDLAQRLVSSIESSKSSILSASHEWVDGISQGAEQVQSFSVENEK